MQPQKPSVGTDNLLQHISVAKVLAGNISLGSGATFDAHGIANTYNRDNGNGQLMRFTFVAANTDTAISHGLGRIPSGYILVRANTPVSLYDAMTNAGWDTKQLVIRATAVADTTIYIF